MISEGKEGQTAQADYLARLYFSSPVHLTVVIIFNWPLDAQHY